VGLSSTLILNDELMVYKGYKPLLSSLFEQNLGIILNNYFSEFPVEGSCLNYSF
jgi:hypothetical protein